MLQLIGKYKKSANWNNAISDCRITKFGKPYKTNQYARGRPEWEGKIQIRLPFKAKKDEGQCFSNSLYLIVEPEEVDHIWELLQQDTGFGRGGRYTDHSQDITHWPVVPDFRPIIKTIVRPVGAVTNRNTAYLHFETMEGVRFPMVQQEGVNMLIDAFDKSMVSIRGFVANLMVTKKGKTIRADYIKEEDLQTMLDKGDIIDLSAEEESQFESLDQWFNPVLHAANTLIRPLLERSPYKELLSDEIA